MPPAGELRVRDVTHSTMVLYWDAAPGAVRKYKVIYQAEDGDPKEVSFSLIFIKLHKTNLSPDFLPECCVSIPFMQGNI